MSTFLDRMRQSSLDRLQQALAATPLSEQRQHALEIPTQHFPDVDFAVIAEVKPVSPLEGNLGSVSAVDQAVSYQAGGAAAISVLTEPTEFGGSLQLMKDVAGTVQTPVLRKDFIVDPYQVWEARAFGADGVLAIARMFNGGSLRQIVEVAAEADVFILLEAFDASDLKMIDEVLDVEAQLLVGVNSRDLATLKVRRDAHQALVPHLPPGVPAIAESGIETLDQVRSLSVTGYDGVLVGTALMRSEQPGESVREMIGAAMHA